MLTHHVEVIMKLEELITAAGTHVSIERVPYESDTIKRVRFGTMLEVYAQTMNGDVLWIHKLADNGKIVNINDDTAKVMLMNRAKIIENELYEALVKEKQQSVNLIQAWVDDASMLERCTMIRMIVDALPYGPDKDGVDYAQAVEMLAHTIGQALGKPSLETVVHRVIYHLVLSLLEKQVHVLDVNSMIQGHVNLAIKDYYLNEDRSKAP
jgi:uncharacterized RmlC-like cupin family protein